MAEEVQDMLALTNETTQEEEEAAVDDVETRIKDAMRSRVPYFKQQADSLTFEGVRRLLEKDLGLEKFALDVHKRFVKERLVECLEGVFDDNASKDSVEIGGNNVNSAGRDAEKSDDLDSKSNVKDSYSGDEGKLEDSPVMGLLTGQRTSKSKPKKTEAIDNKEVPSESNIKKALWRRASYIKANSEKITMAGLRRLLEKDLKLAECALDPYKKFISNHLDEILKSREVSEPKKKIVKKDSPRQVSMTMSSEESSDSLDSESNEDIKMKKKAGPAKKMQKSDGPGKRKRPEKETKFSGQKRTKASDTVAEDGSEVEDGGKDSEDNNSQSSAEKPSKKKEASTPTYGKHVEHLKSVIKSCGMSIPPVIYKKVKQVPENKREAQLIKELEDILSKEGLSSNPSEKEIKDVRKKKERAKELEGIDTSNIVSTSRRRSTFSFAPPPKPKITVESEGDDTEDNDDDSNDDNDDGEEDDNDEDDGNDDGDDDGDDESQSDELDDENVESD